MEKNKGLKIFTGFIGAVLLAIALFLGIYNLLHGKRGISEIESLNSAYNNSVKNGFDGSMSDWLSSIDDKFSYEVAVDNGFYGTKEEWYTDLIDIINNYMADDPDPLTYGITNVQVIDGDLVFTFSDGSRIDVGTFGKPGDAGAAGAPGAPGAPGKDGSSVKDLDSVTVEGPDASTGKYKLKFHWTSSEDGTTYEETTNEFDLNVNSVEVVDNLTTEDATKALSAKQGKALNDNKLNKNLGSANSGKILKVGATGEVEFADASTVGANINIATNLTTDDDAWVLSAKQGKILNENKLNNSGYTGDKIGKYLYIASDGKVGFTDATNVTVDSTITSTGTNPVEGKAIYTALEGKVKNDWTTANSGKILKVGSDGKVTTGDLPSAVDVVNDLTTGGTSKALSAEQGKVLGDTLNIVNYNANKGKYLYIDSTGKVGFNDASNVTVDSALSSTSTNPVQNQAIYSALEGKVKNDWTTANSGKILTVGSDGKVTLTDPTSSVDVINDLTTGGTNKALSAEQGKVLKGLVDEKVPIDQGTGTGNANVGKVLKVGADGKLALATDDGTTYTAGTGISITGTTINHSNSITAETTGKGSATAVPIIKYDAQGHITGVDTTAIYPPTSAGTAYQYWRSDADGAGVWETGLSSITGVTGNDLNKLVNGTALKSIDDKFANYILKPTTTDADDGKVLMYDKTNGFVLNSVSGDGTTVVDSLISDSATDALSAKQGKVLKGLIDDIETDYVPWQAGADKVGDADSTDKGKILKVGADGKLALVDDEAATYKGDGDGVTAANVDGSTGPMTIVTSGSDNIITHRAAPDSKAINGSSYKIEDYQADVEKMTYVSTPTGPFKPATSSDVVLHAYELPLQIHFDKYGHTVGASKQKFYIPTGPSLTGSGADTTTNYGAYWRTVSQSEETNNKTVIDWATPIKDLSQTITDDTLLVTGKAVKDYVATASSGVSVADDTPVILDGDSKLAHDSLYRKLDGVTDEEAQAAIIADYLSSYAQKNLSFGGGNNLVKEIQIDDFGHVYGVTTTEGYLPTDDTKFKYYMAQGNAEKPDWQYPIGMNSTSLDMVLTEDTENLLVTASEIKAQLDKKVDINQTDAGVFMRTDSTGVLKKESALDHLYSQFTDSNSTGLVTVSGINEGDVINLNSTVSNALNTSGQYSFTTAIADTYNKVFINKPTVECQIITGYGPEDPSDKHRDPIYSSVYFHPTDQSVSYANAYAKFSETGEQTVTYITDTIQRTNDKGEPNGEGCYELSFTYKKEDGADGTLTADLTFKQSSSYIGAGGITVEGNEIKHSFTPGNGVRGDKTKIPQIMYDDYGHIVSITEFDGVEHLYNYTDNALVTADATREGDIVSVYDVTDAYDNYFPKVAGTEDYPASKIAPTGWNNNTSLMNFLNSVVKNKPIIEYGIYDKEDSDNTNDYYYFYPTNQGNDIDTLEVGSASGWPVVYRADAYNGYYILKITANDKNCQNELYFKETNSLPKGDDKKYLMGNGTSVDPTWQAGVDHLYNNFISGILTTADAAREGDIISLSTTYVPDDPSKTKSFSIASGSEGEKVWNQVFKSKPIIETKIGTTYYYFHAVEQNKTISSIDNTAYKAVYISDTPKLNADGTVNTDGYYHLTFEKNEDNCKTTLKFIDNSVKTEDHLYGSEDSLVANIGAIKEGDIYTVDTQTEAVGSTGYLPWLNTTSVSDTSNTKTITGITADSDEEIFLKAAFFNKPTLESYVVTEYTTDPSDTATGGKVLYFEPLTRGNVGSSSAALFSANDSITYVCKDGNETYTLEIKITSVTGGKVTGAQLTLSYVDALDSFTGYDETDDANKLATAEAIRNADIYTVNKDYIPWLNILRGSGMTTGDDSRVSEFYEFDEKDGAEHKIDNDFKQFVKDVFKNKPVLEAYVVTEYSDAMGEKTEDNHKLLYFVPSQQSQYVSDDFNFDDDEYKTIYECVDGTDIFVLTIEKTQISRTLGSDPEDMFKITLEHTNYDSRYVTISQSNTNLGKYLFVDNDDKKVTFLYPLTDLVNPDPGNMDHLVTGNAIINATLKSFTTYDKTNDAKKLATAEAIRNADIYVVDDGIIPGLNTTSVSSTSGSNTLTNITADSDVEKFLKVAFFNKPTLERFVVTNGSSGGKVLYFEPLTSDIDGTSATGTFAENDSITYVCKDGNETYTLKIDILTVSDSRATSAKVTLSYSDALDSIAGYDKTNDADKLATTEAIRKADVYHVDREFLPKLYLSGGIPSKTVTNAVILNDPDDKAKYSELYENIIGNRPELECEVALDFEDGVDDDDDDTEYTKLYFYPYDYDTNVNDFESFESLQGSSVTYQAFINNLTFGGKKYDGILEFNIEKTTLTSANPSRTIKFTLSFRGFVPYEQGNDNVGKHLVVNNEGKLNLSDTFDTWLVNKNDLSTHFSILPSGTIPAEGYSLTVAGTDGDNYKLAFAGKSIVNISGSMVDEGAVNAATGPALPVYTATLKAGYDGYSPTLSSLIFTDTDNLTPVSFNGNLYNPVGHEDASGSVRQKNYYLSITNNYHVNKADATDPSFVWNILIITDAASNIEKRGDRFKFEIYDGLEFGNKNPEDINVVKYSLFSMLKNVPSYDASKNQYLGHSTAVGGLEAVLQWFEATTGS